MKKYSSVAFLSLLALTLTACATTSNVPNNESPEASVSENLKGDYINMPVKEAQTLAESQGVPFRVVIEDGEGLPATLDYRPGRINATVANGLVVSYETEGR